MDESNLQAVAAALQQKRHQIEQTRRLHAQQAQEMLSSVSYTAFRQVYAGVTGPIPGPPQPALLAAALPGTQALSLGEMERQRLVKLNTDEIERQRRLQLVNAQQRSSPPSAHLTQQQHQQHLYNRFGPAAVPPPPVSTYAPLLDPAMQHQQQQHKQAVVPQRLPQHVLVRVRENTRVDPVTDRTNVLMSQANREVEHLALQEKLRESGRGEHLLPTPTPTPHPPQQQQQHKHPQPTQAVAPAPAVSYKHQPHQHHPSAASSKATAAAVATAILPLGAIVPREVELEKWSWDETPPLLPSTATSSSHHHHQQQQQKQQRPMTDYELRSSMLLRRQNRSQLGEPDDPHQPHHHHQPNKQQFVDDNNTSNMNRSFTENRTATLLGRSASLSPSSSSSSSSLTRPIVRVSAEWPESEAFAVAASEDAANYARSQNNNSFGDHEHGRKTSTSSAPSLSSSSISKNVHFSSSSSSSPNHRLPIPSPTKGTLAGLRGSERAKEAVERVEASLSPQRNHHTDGRTSTSTSPSSFLANKHDHHVHHHEHAAKSNDFERDSRQAVAWFAPIRGDLNNNDDNETETNPLIPNASAPLLSSQSLVAQKRRLEQMKKQAAAASTGNTVGGGGGGGHVSYQTSADDEERKLQEAQARHRKAMEYSRQLKQSASEVSAPLSFGANESAIDKAKLRKIESLRARKEAEDAARKAQWAAARKASSSSYSEGGGRISQQEKEEMLGHRRQTDTGQSLVVVVDDDGDKENAKEKNESKIQSTRIPRLSPRGIEKGQHVSSSSSSSSSVLTPTSGIKPPHSRYHSHILNNNDAEKDDDNHGEVDHSSNYHPHNIRANESSSNRIQPLGNVRYTVTNMTPIVAPLRSNSRGGGGGGSNFSDNSSPQTPLVPLPPFHNEHIIQPTFPLAAAVAATAASARAHSTTPSTQHKRGGPTHHHVTQSEAAAARAAAAAAAAAAAEVKTSITPSGVGGHGGSTTSSNRQKISNALQSLCLAGPARAAHLAAALAALGNSSSPSFLILLSSPESHCYKGLYSFDPRTSVCLRIHGIGPTQLTSAALLARQRARDAAGEGSSIDRSNSDDAEALAAAAAAKSEFVVDGTYKFSTSSKQFIPILSKEVGLTSDAVTIRRR